MYGCQVEYNLTIDWSNTIFKEYGASLKSFVDTLKKVFDSSSSIDIDLDSTAIEQLWETVKGVVTTLNSWMAPFLKAFGVEEGNEISSFAVYIESPSNHIKLMGNFFEHLSFYTRGSNSGTNNDNNSALRMIMFLSRMPKVTRNFHSHHPATNI